jgi:GNAT superfamily N-acetyltransferase
MTKIRKATELDIDSIRDIAIKTWNVAYKDILSKEQRSYMLEMMYSESALKEQMSNGHIFYIAEYEGNSAGFISCETEYGTENALKIHKYYVLPTFQEKGIGSALLEEAEQLALSTKSAILTLNVNRFNKAVEHYISRGFSIAYSEDIDIGNGYLMDDFVMEKKITYI